MSDSNTQYDINNMIGFTTVGILIKLFFGSPTEDGSSGPASSSIWGYGVVALAILSLLVITFGLASSITAIENYNVFGFLKTLVKNSLPSLLTLIVLLWLITLNVIYFKRINQGKVANEYYNYSNITTLIVIGQIMILFKYLKDKFAAVSGNVSTAGADKMAYVTYFLTFLNFVFIGIMTIVLEFFSTDG
uniref:Uncharacterized protein n=1 Tax=viral metagenome TaxID=1070528 RepID=A0A6C0HFQ6_9ZZZZ